jgi:PAS domain S-box-containing protein
LDVRSRRLETTLVTGYVALSVLITLLSLLGGRVIQWHAEIERALRTDLVQRTEQLLSLAGSISEEGFSYVVSGDVHEEQQTLTKLAELDMRALKMRSQESLSDGESRGLAGVIHGAEQLRAEAAQMFAAYRATGRVPNERYVTYDAAVDDLAADIETLRGAVATQLEVDLRRAQRTADWLTLLAGIAAVSTGLGVGRVLGRRITKPIVALRNAALAFAEGRLSVPSPAASNDEVGDLTRAFDKMVTETRLHIQTIASGQERLSDIFASLGEMLLVCDAEGIIVAANPVACRLSGYGEHELLGRPGSALFSAGDFPPPEQAIPALPYENDTSLKTASGEHLPVRVLVSRLRGEQRDGWVCVANDLTERRRLEVELRQAHKMDAIGRLAGGIAHDFNNMLSIILGYAAFLLEGLSETDPLRDPLMEMKIAGERSADLTHQLLCFSRQHALQAIRVNLGGIVSTTAKMVRRVLPANVALTIAGDPLGCDVEVEPGQMEQVLMNLVINARDAMPNGGTISVATAIVDVRESERGVWDNVPSGRYATLSVSDNGTGMNSDTLERIFEPFFTTKDQGKGTGLGLSTVFGIVHQCNGHIFVQSALGVGTTFKIYLPESSSTSSTEANPEIAAWAGEPNETVLVVEDEEQVRTLVTTILGARGYRILSAGTPEEALSISERHAGTIDVLLTDVMMPRMDGRNLALQVLARRPNTKVIYMSGYAEDIVLDHGPTGQDTSFLQKPITPERLGRKIRSALGRPIELASA